MSPPNTDEENDLEAQYRHTGVHVNLEPDYEEDPFDAGLLDPKTRSGKRLAPLPNKGSRKELKMSSVNDALHAFITMQNAKAKRLKTSSFEATSVLADDSLSSCMSILNVMTLLVEVRVKALSMFKDPDWRKMFLEMSDELRDGWLMSL
ncbi:uncharacterized protein LOC120011739 [Tripterygium wilfordii]|nr:uncharacterized protein LOC120011739 [Tripterygium wilfordii]